MKIPGADKAVNNLARWAAREEWSEALDEVIDRHLGAVCDEYGIQPDELPASLGEHLYAAVMGSIFEDFLAGCFGDDERNVVDDYLKRRGWRESVPGKRYLAAVRDSVMSLYEVSDLESGRHLVLRDLIRGGDPIRVWERRGSETAARWDRLATRVVNVNGRDFISGAVLHFPHEAADMVLEFFERSAKKVERNMKKGAKRRVANDPVSNEDVKTVLLAQFANVFTRFWLSYTLDELSQAMPQMRNFEGHEIIFNEVRFPIVPDAGQEVERLLDDVEFLSREAEDVLRWSWLQGADVKRSIDSSEDAGRSNTWDTRDEVGNRILGTIELTEGNLVLRTNSRERAERGKKLLVDLLGSLVGQPLTSVQTLEQALADRGKTEEAPTELSTLPPEAASGILREALERHYRESLDMPIPMLGNKTPRQAVRSKKGKEKVVEWLKYLENQNERHGQKDLTGSYDFSWMWEELGIGEMRR